VTLDDVDPARLLAVKDGWLDYLKAVLPLLGLRMSQVAGVAPERDGHIQVRDVPRANAAVRAGPRYVFTAGMFYALYDLAAELALVSNYPGVTLLAAQPARPTPAVVRRYVNYTPRPDPAGVGRPVSDTSSKTRFRPPAIAFEVPPERYDLFAGLWLSALSFIYLHEQQHFLRGHLLFLDREFHVSEWMEAVKEEAVKEEASSRVDTLTACALEWDADMNAVVATLQAAHSLRSPRLAAVAGAPPEEQIATAVSGALLAMAVLGAADRDLNPNPEDRRHPTPAYRILTVLTVLRLFLNETALTEAQSAQAIRTAVQAANLAFNRVDAYDDLEVALKMYVGDLDPSHELFSERTRVVLRADAIQEQIDGYSGQIDLLFPERRDHDPA